MKDVFPDHDAQGLYRMNRTNHVGDPLQAEFFEPEATASQEPNHTEILDAFKPRFPTHFQHFEGPMPFMENRSSTYHNVQLSHETGSRTRDFSTLYRDTVPPEPGVREALQSRFTTNSSNPISVQPPSAETVVAHMQQLRPWPPTSNPMHESEALAAGDRTPAKASDEQEALHKSLVPLSAEDWVKDWFSLPRYVVNI